MLNHYSVDRAHGKEFSQTFEESCLKLEDVLAMTEKQNVERQAMVEMLEQSELYYDAQYGEAKIVANVSNKAALAEAGCLLYSTRPAATSAAAAVICFQDNY